jgi:hypothetical protein
MWPREVVEGGESLTKWTTVSTRDAKNALVKPAWLKETNEEIVLIKMMKWRGRVEGDEPTRLRWRETAQTRKITQKERHETEL